MSQNPTEFGGETAAEHRKTQTSTVTSARVAPGRCYFREMKPMPANQNTIKQDAGAQTERRKAPDLDSRYGSIGISAVAAALPYGGDAKNTRYAPSEAAPWRAHEDAA
jgi:hypothetical protein